MSKEYLFTVHSYQNENEPIQHVVNVKLGEVSHLKARLPEDFSEKLTQLVAEWVKSEVKLMKLAPKDLKHDFDCHCGHCPATPFTESVTWEATHAANRSW